MAHGSDPAPLNCYHSIQTSGTRAIDPRLHVITGFQKGAILHGGVTEIESGYQFGLEYIFSPELCEDESIPAVPPVLSPRTLWSQELGRMRLAASVVPSGSP